MNKVMISLLLTAGIFAGCKNENPETAAYSPDPETYTRYTDKLELFVEFKPLVLGQESRFASHFTLLGESFLPMEKAKVTVSLILGDKGIRSSTEVVSVPGIFPLALSPTVAGIGKLIFDIETPDFKDQIVIENIPVYTDEKAALADGAGTSHPGGEISYLKEQAWKTEFANAPVKRQLFYEVIKTSGQIMPAPGDERIITANSAGIVFFLDHSSIVGSPVSKGQAIFAISGEGLTEDNIDTKFREAKANYEKAKADYERAQALVKDQIISQKDFLEAQNRYETTQNTYKALARNYSSGGTKISSPIQGFLKNIFVREGQFVQVGDPIASVSQNKKIVLKADVSQKYFSKLGSVNSANFITVDHKVYNTEELNGKLIAFGKSTGTHNAFIPVTFEIDNRGEMLPGSYVEVFLKSESINDVLVIPVSALLEEQGHFFVYVQTGGESFSRREVKLGGNDGKLARVLSGLREGERVVTKGAYSIKLSAASGTLPEHGHEH